VAIQINSKAIPNFYFGRLKDPDDTRDYSFETFKNPSKFIPLKNASSEQAKEVQQEQVHLKKFAEFLKEGAKFDINDLPTTGLPEVYDFIGQLSSTNDQGPLGSCTRQSVSCTIEYFNKVVNGKDMKDSILYGYKKTRDILNNKGEEKPSGDTGATLRAAMKALRIYGYIDQSEYPYVIANFDKSIPQYLKDLGAENQGLRQIRIDTVGKGGDAIIADIKKWIWYEVPIVFGFWVYDSCLVQSNKPNLAGKIPFPDPNSLEHEQIAGGHAVTIVGYNDNMVITNLSKTGQILGRTKGAVIIRNSWKNWGKVLSINGKTYSNYGYLPYEYFRRKLGSDLWVNLDQEFMDLKIFDDE